MKVIYNTWAELCLLHEDEPIALVCYSKWSFFTAETSSPDFADEELKVWRLRMIKIFSEP